MATKPGELGFYYNYTETRCLVNTSNEFAKNTTQRPPYKPKTSCVTCIVLLL
mgnify:CR=1 FL=1